MLLINNDWGERKYMSDNIFRTLINRRIDSFINTYEQDADSLFKRDDRLIHPGEYGEYKEKCLKLLLKDCMKKDYSIGDGFIYNKNNEISTQCDVIIYNSGADGITSDGVASFYPVEEVLAVGEVKSTLTKSELRHALRKLSDTKYLFSYLENESKDLTKIKADQVLPITFLVCQRIEGFETIDGDYWNSVYENRLDLFRHNVVLSVEDGYLAYKITVGDVLNETSKTSGSWAHPVLNGKKLSEITFSIDQSNKYKHFYSFIGMLRNSVEAIEKNDFPIIEYLGIKNDEFEDELSIGSNKRTMNLEK